MVTDAPVLAESVGVELNVGGNNGGVLSEPVITELNASSLLSVGAEVACVDAIDGLNPVIMPSNLDTAKLVDSAPVDAVPNVLIDSVSDLVDNRLINGVGILPEVVGGVLSPNATPFVPNVATADLAIITSEKLNTLVEGAVVNSDIVLDSEMGEAVPFLPNDSENGVPALDTIVDVPVNLINPQAMANSLGDCSGLEIRNQTKWSAVDSISESTDDEVYSDTDYDFSVVSAKIEQKRGKFWGRRRRRH
ncbi:hypothetical protein MA16_Dca016742 [Dendrobium catenatum]|uniref:Uncharacterized protein n=1 Tax=Dendrobium catenatum TaxID=906689 RepID=A0A2I0VJM4_9ASPA|nr:hypothetical protein MA16_Dca016742 [Dendrobium catenatum]